MGTRALRPHVLLIHDTQTMLDVLRESLEAAGYRVSVRGTTLDRARLTALAPEVIVQNLPDGPQAATGWDLLTMVQLAPELAPIPVILCTSVVETVSHPVMAAKLDHLGIRVLLKPFTREELLNAIREMLTAEVLLDQVRDHAKLDAGQ